MHRMQSPLRQKAGVVLGLIDFDLFALNLAQHSVGSLYLLALPFLITVGLYYCFNNLSDARIFIIMYGVTSMYFSAVMVRPLFQATDSPKALVFCQRDASTRCLFAPSSGPTDVGSGSSHVHSVGDRCVPGPHHLHEELGREPARQEKQEAAGLHLPHQK